MVKLTCHTQPRMPDVDEGLYCGGGSCRQSPMSPIWLGRWGRSGQSQVSLYGVSRWPIRPERSDTLRIVRKLAARMDLSDLQ